MNQCIVLNEKIVSWKTDVIYNVSAALLRDEQKAEWVSVVFQLTADPSGPPPSSNSCFKNFWKFPWLRKLEGGQLTLCPTLLSHGVQHIKYVLTYYVCNLTVFLSGCDPIAYNSRHFCTVFVEYGFGGWF